MFRARTRVLIRCSPHLARTPSPRQIAAELRGKPHLARPGARGARGRDLLATRPRSHVGSPWQSPIIARRSPAEHVAEATGTKVDASRRWPPAKGEVRPGCPSTHVLRSALAKVSAADLSGSNNSLGHQFWSRVLGRESAVPRPLTRIPRPSLTVPGRNRQLSSPRARRREVSTLRRRSPPLNERRRRLP